MSMMYRDYIVLVVVLLATWMYLCFEDVYDSCLTFHYLLLESRLYCML